MKKFFTNEFALSAILAFAAIIAFAFFALTATSCAKTDELSCTKTDELSGAKKISLSATILNGSGTKAEFTDNNDGTLKVSWSAKDTILVCNTTDAASNETAVFTTSGASGSSATFTGTLTKLADHHYLSAYYPSDLQVTLNGNEMNVTRDYSSQKGTLEYLQKNALMEAYITNYTAETGMKFTFTHDMAVFKVSLTMPEAVTISKATLSSNDKSLENKYGNYTATYGVAYGNIIVNFETPRSIAAGGKLEFYILIPQSVYDIMLPYLQPGTLPKINNLTITAENADASKVYVAALENTAQIMNGKMYRINKTAARSCRIGDYLFSDGSWGPISAKPSGASVIGVIFQNNPFRISKSTIIAQNGSTQCTHGLAIALHDTPNSGKIDVNSLSWKTSGTDAYGSSYYVSDQAGLYNDVYGYNYTFGTSAPTANVPANSSTYPAFSDCIIYGNTVTPPSTCSKWFLPSAGQWIDILNNLGKGIFSASISKGDSQDINVLENLNNAIYAAGGDKLTSEVYYWTSTEENATDSYSVSTRYSTSSSVYTHLMNTTKTAGGLYAYGRAIIAF
jgi:hypothetical protein